LGAFRRDGHRNAADLLAAVSGVSTGAAMAALATGKQLASAPDVADAVRRGDLSGPQAAVVAGAAAPDQARLLELAVQRRRGLKGLQEEAARAAHARRSEADSMQRYRAVHQARHLRSWVRDGAFCFAGATTPDEGA